MWYVQPADELHTRQMWRNSWVQNKLDVISIGTISLTIYDIRSSWVYMNKFKIMRILWIKLRLSNKIFNLSVCLGGKSNYAVSFYPMRFEHKSLK